MTGHVYVYTFEDQQGDIIDEIFCEHDKQHYHKGQIIELVDNRMADIDPDSIEDWNEVEFPIIEVTIESIYEEPEVIEMRGDNELWHFTLLVVKEN